MIKGLFALLAGLAVVGALAGLSRAVIAADRSEARANAVRLALWRLDAQANALVLAETAIPLEHWQQSATVPPVRVRQLIAGTDPRPAKPGAAGAGATADVPPRATGSWANSAAIDSPAAAIASSAASAGSAMSAGSAASFSPGQPFQDATQAAVQDAQARDTSSWVSKSKAADYGQRAANSRQLQNTLNDNRPSSPTPAERQVALQPIAGAPELRWQDGDLLLDRPLTQGGTARTQLDWPRWRGDLLTGVADLLPAASLRPVQVGDDDRLASLPVALDAGALETPLAAATVWLLFGAWAAGLGGLAAVLIAMAAAARLAERRAAFVSAVTHELRTPLTALRLHGDLLADARIAGDAERRAAPVAAVRDGAIRLAHLIDNVLDYARLERRSPPAPRAVALDSLLGELEARLPDVAIPPLPALTVRADPQAVERILANLADNARKYGKPPYALSITSGTRRVQLVLTDHGPGLAADAQARLFTPFARSAEAAAGEAPGVGLGLALCRRLARAQGGELMVENAPGGGVRAVLTLRLG